MIGRALRLPSNVTGGATNNPDKNLHDTHGCRRLEAPGSGPDLRGGAQLVSSRDDPGYRRRRP